MSAWQLVQGAEQWVYLSDGRTDNDARAIASHPVRTLTGMKHPRCPVCPECIKLDGPGQAQVCLISDALRINVLLVANARHLPQAKYPMTIFH